MDLAPPTAFDRPRVGPLAALLGVVRVGAVLVLIAVGALLVLLAALVPGQVRGARPALWVAVGLCRGFVAITGIRLRVENAGALRQHRGFVFFNHLSFLDVVVLLAAGPVRFLAAAGVRKIPFVGWMADGVGTLYVHRGDDASRREARQALASALAASPTPVALAPEGRIGPGPGVLPLRHGAFEVAREAGAPILLVALQFAPPGHAEWHPGEWLLTPLWRLCARTHPFRATVTVLPPALDGTDAPAAALAEAAERRLNAVLAGAPLGGQPLETAVPSADR